MAEVILKDVEKVYPGGVKAVQGISLDAPDGAFVVLVGPSGCGKSTLLRMIAGLERITSGTVEIGGRVVNELEPAERDIAMVFQNYALYPHMKVFDNMAYGLKNRGFDKAEIRRRVDEAAKILELDQLLDRKPRALSGGQRQRVAMGRAIVREPAAFLFDEPLSNLDARLRLAMRLEIKRLHQRLGVTSIYVTHDQTEAMTLADVLVVMNAGVAEQIGGPQEIYAQPATPFVAGFIGHNPMNLLKGEIAEGGSVKIGEALNLPLSAPLAPGSKITLGLRPEDVTLGPAAPDQLSGRLKVEIVEPQGGESLLHGAIAGQPVTLRAHGDSPVKPGETLDFALAPGRAHLFAEGQRVALPGA